MQEICATNPWAGHGWETQQGINLGGYCEGDDVAFRFRRWTVPGATAHPLLYTRAFLECRSRCFCNHNLANPDSQPKLLPVTRKTFSGPLPSARLIRDRKALAIPVDRKVAPATWATPELLTRILVNVAGGHAGTQGNDVGIHPANTIQCGGPLPDFELPGPWTVSEFANNQALCAVQLSGGNPAANAGAYCHREGTDGKTVAFADDMTPRWDWTWNAPGTSFFAVASLRFHCWKNCLCAVRSKEPGYVDPQIAMWDFVLSRAPRGAIAVTKGNRNPLGSSTDAEGAVKTTSTASGGNQPAAQCTADSKHPGTCAVPWPVGMMGPVPAVVARMALPRPPPSDWDQAKQCGNRCESNSDCGGKCICKVPSTQEAHSLGLDPISAVALCITFVSVFG